jgi:hypothetical protein
MLIDALIVLSITTVLISKQLALRRMIIVRMMVQLHLLKSSQVEPTTLPFPIPTDHSKKIKENNITIGM